MRWAQSVVLGRFSVRGSVGDVSVRGSMGPGVWQAYVRHCSSSVREQKTVLVTGAARGIGQEVAKQLVSKGFRVLALDKDFSQSELSFNDGSLLRVDYDLRQIEGIKTLVSELGPVHTLVNNAGQLYCPIDDGLSDGDLGFSSGMSDDIITTNLRAPVALIEALAPQMHARAQLKEEVAGRIVNVGSVSAFTGHPDLWYGATKAALLNITKTFAAIFGKHGSRVLVNAVAPGPTLTQMYEDLPQSRKDMVMRTVYSKRPAFPAEVAEAIVWLGTESPEYVNGTTVDVNNGSYPR